MKLQEMLAILPDEKIELQYIDQCIQQVRANRDSSIVTFGTRAIKASDISLDSEGKSEFSKVGIIVWVPRSDYFRILEQEAPVEREGKQNAGQ